MIIINYFKSTETLKHCFNKEMKQKKTAIAVSRNYNKNGFLFLQ